MKVTSLVAAIASHAGKIWKNRFGNSWSLLVKFRCSHWLAFTTIFSVLSLVYIWILLFGAFAIMMGYHVD